MNADPEQAPMNAAMEDLIARAGGTSHEDDAKLFHAWLMLGAEYMARAVGRRWTMDTLMQVRGFIRDAEPATPWKD